jgi:hypothetical protein
MGCRRSLVLPPQHMATEAEVVYGDIEGAPTICTGSRDSYVAGIGSEVLERPLGAPISRAMLVNKKAAVSGSCDL